MERSRLDELNRPGEGGDFGTDTLPARMTRVIESVVYDLTCGRSVFVSGPAGTGKSVLVKNVCHILEHLTKRPAVRCAPTGIAARVISGMTVHHQFGIARREIYLDMPEGKQRDRAIMRLRGQSPCCIVIDEVSMVRRDLFDVAGRLIANVNGYARPHAKMDVPLLVVGDLLQLPPVVKPAELAELQRHYRTKATEMLPCSSGRWVDFDFRCYELTDPLRQGEAASADYVWALGDVRVHGPAAKDGLAWLAANTRQTPDPGAPRILPHVEDVKRANAHAIHAILDNYAVHEVHLEDRIFEVNAALGNEADNRGWLRSVGHVRRDDDANVICEGAEVIIGANNVDDGYVNGDIGFVRAIDLKHESPEWVDVVMRDDPNKVVRVTRTQLDHCVLWDRECLRTHLRAKGLSLTDDGRLAGKDRLSSRDLLTNGDAYASALDPDSDVRYFDLVTHTLTTLPVQLAYAMTIHKAQGQTIGRLDVDTRSLWAPGQFYVAVSRCRRASDLCLLGGIDASSVHVSEEARAYLDHVDWVADDDLRTFDDDTADTTGGNS